MILGNQKKRLQNLFEEEYGGERLQKEPRVKLFFAGFSLHVTLSGKGSYADLSENKSQNRGSYLSFRIFAGCASNKVVLKEGSRCNFLDMSSTIAGNWIAIDLLCAKLETTWEPFMDFEQFSFWRKTVAIIIYRVLIFMASSR